MRDLIAGARLPAALAILLASCGGGAPAETPTTSPATTTTVPATTTTDPATTSTTNPTSTTAAREAGGGEDAGGYGAGGYDDYGPADASPTTVPPTTVPPTTVPSTTVPASTVPATTTSVAAGSQIVPMSGSAFLPSSITVPVGTTVVFRNDDGYAHTTTSGDGTTGSADGLWNSGSLGPGATFARTFDQPGTYTFFCSFHWAGGMTGTVTVTG